jgi:phospholipid/cholesterol/gamma-HCH transport system permease protein
LRDERTGPDRPAQGAVAELIAGVRQQVRHHERLGVRWYPVAGPLPPPRPAAELARCPAEPAAPSVPPAASPPALFAEAAVARAGSLAMLRELSPLLTAIIIAGRSGSAYTAQIGTMKVTEEIDALRTIGVGAQELLVLPKLLALVVVMPLLTGYTDGTGVLGGMGMAQSKLGVGFDAFVDRLDEAIQPSSYWTGLAKAPVFAMIVALVGCYRGFQVTGSAESVGTQTTMSVVQSIFLVIVTDALFSIVFLWLDL